MAKVKTTKATKTTKDDKGCEATEKPPKKAAAGDGGSATVWDVTTDHDIDFVGGDNLAYEDRVLLGRVARFLYSVVEPRFHPPGAACRLRQGRAPRDLAAVQRRGGARCALARRADGWRRRPQALLLELDEFENTWFPRTRDIIRRNVRGDKGEAFLAQFFLNMEQQPLGPAVAESVGKYLGRVDALATVKWHGAKLVLEKLRGRGVTEELATELREKIKQVGGEQRRPEPSNAAEVRGALAAQTEAIGTCASRGTTGRRRSARSTTCASRSSSASPR